MGIVIGHSSGGRWEEWLVMWTMGDSQVEFDWHVADALMVVEPSNMSAVRNRCRLGS